MTSLPVVTIILLLQNLIGGSKQELAPGNVPSLLSNVLQTYSDDGAVTIIHDEPNSVFASEISCLLDRKKQMMFSYQQVHTALVPVIENLMEHASLEQVRDQLQFLVVCEVTCVERLFTEIMKLDRIFGQGSLLRHFSTWLIFSPDELPPLNITLDNVAWVCLSKTKTFGLKTLQDVHTLLWMPTRREWSKIALPEKRESILYSHFFPNTNRGLNGRELIIVALEWPGHVVKKTVNNQMRYSGVGLDVVNILKRKFNFSFIMVEPEDNLWGQQLDNGSINGLLGMLHRQEAHLSPVPYSITLQRSLLIDISSPISSTAYILVCKRNRTGVSSWLFLVSSYSWPVYVCGTGSLTLVVLVFAYLYIRKQKKYNEWYFDVIVRIPFRQDIQLIPKSMASRIMVFTWSIFCLMFAAVYTSNLVSRSAVDNYFEPFNTIKELTEQTDYKIIVFEGGILIDVLKDSNSLVYQKVYERLDILQMSKMEPLDEIVDRLLTRILNEPCVAILTIEIKVLLFSKTCKLLELQEQINAAMVGLPFPKYSPLKKLFDKQLRSLVDMGIYDLFKKEWFPKPNICDSRIHRMQFTIDHLKSGLIVVSCCILVSGLLLLIENIRQRK